MVIYNKYYIHIYFIYMYNILNWIKSLFTNKYEKIIIFQNSWNKTRITEYNNRICYNKYSFQIIYY